MRNSFVILAKTTGPNDTWLTLTSENYKKEMKPHQQPFNDDDNNNNNSQR